MDPKNTTGSRKPGEAYTTLKPLEAHRALLDRVARPWLYGPAALAARLDREQDEAYARMFTGMQA